MSWNEWKSARSNAPRPVRVHLSLVGQESPRIVPLSEAAEKLSDAGPISVEANGLHRELTDAIKALPGGDMTLRR